MVEWGGTVNNDPLPVPVDDQGAEFLDTPTPAHTDEPNNPVQTDEPNNPPINDPTTDKPVTIPIDVTNHDPTHDNLNDIVNDELTDDDPIEEALEAYNHGHQNKLNESDTMEPTTADENQEATIYDEQGAELLEDTNDHPFFEQLVEHVDDSEEGENNPTENDDTLGSDQGAAYNLRNRASIKPPVRLVQVMDNSTKSKSYDTPTVLFQKIMTQASLGTIQPSIKSKSNLERTVFGRVFAQLNAKAAISLYGEDAVEALMKEFAQLDDLGVFQARRADELTWEQRKAALRAINLVTKKRDGRIKGRTVADGSVQRNLYEKSQTASPTVSTDALLLTLIVDAHEERDVAIADVAGAYLKADMKDFTVLKFTGESVDIMCKMNDSYEEFVTVENGKRVLYVQLLKALYGCVVSTLLWYQMFAGALKEMGFELNPYDSCVANKMVNNKQCTIAWYVDDMKISHVDSTVVTNIIESIEKKFGKMSITRGKSHRFLGMDITFQGNKTVEIQMKEYLQESINESNLNIVHSATTPTRASLFTIDGKAELLQGEEFDVFRSVVAKLLYVAIRARMDILLPVSFLCTRVTKSTKQDQRKLKRVLEYVKGTLDLTYTLGSDSLQKLHSWVDAAFAVHPDMKSHTGGVTSFGLGGVLCKSSKQKLNTRSSTEAELVGASEYLPNTIWVKQFMEAQGHEMTEMKFEQDNESAIKMETNGRMSAGQKSRHIGIRYFWIKDRTENLGIKIEHCPTLMMLADLFTKPLNGSLFKKFRDVILGYKHVSTLRDLPSLAVEERVGESNVGRLPDGQDDAQRLNKAEENVGELIQRMSVTWADRVAGKRSAESVHPKQLSLFRMNPADK